MAKRAFQIKHAGSGEVAYVEKVDGRRNHYIATFGGSNIAEGTRANVNLGVEVFFRARHNPNLSAEYHCIYRHGDNLGMVSVVNSGDQYGLALAGTLLEIEGKTFRAAPEFEQLCLRLTGSTGKARRRAAAESIAQSDV